MIETAQPHRNHVAPTRQDVTNVRERSIDGSAPARRASAADESPLRSLRPLHASLDVAIATNRGLSLEAAASAFCDALADRVRAERVALGVQSGAYVHVVALSHTRSFSRSTPLLRDIEAAMDECADQGATTHHPALTSSTDASRAAARLSGQHGATRIAVIPIHRGAEVAAVLLLERATVHPLDESELEFLRLSSELCAPRLLELFARDRALGAWLTHSVRELATRALGPAHIGSKLSVLAALGLALYFVFGQTPRYAEAPFELESDSRRVVVAPYDGFLASLPRHTGEVVRAATDVMATIDTAELTLELAQARAEGFAERKQAAVHQRDNHTGEAQMAQARAEQAAAEVELLEYKIRQAAVTSPIDGVIVRCDLEGRLGTRLNTGDVLFEIADTAALHALITLPEDEAPDVALGQRGELATASSPGEKIPFVVVGIEPAARSVGQQNVFRVRAALDVRKDWLKPGMRGVARIEVGRTSHLHVWTRRLVNWIRMQLWV